MAYLIRRPNGYLAINEKLKGTVIYNESTGFNIAGKLADRLKSDLPNIKLAEIKLAEYVKNKAQGLTQQKETTLSEFAEIFLTKGCKKIKAKTANTYRQVINDFLTFNSKKYDAFFKKNSQEIDDVISLTQEAIDEWNEIARASTVMVNDKYLKDYTTLDFNDYVGMKKDTCHGYTARNHRASLNRIFNFAEKNDYVVKNRVLGSETVSVDAPDIVVYEHDEFDALMNAIDTFEYSEDTRKDCMLPENAQRYKDIFTWAVYTGLSFSDIRTLKPAMVDLKTGFIYKKRNKTGVSLKIELHSILIPIYERYCHQEYLFLGFRGGLLNGGHLLKVLKKFNKAAGNKPEQDFKAFRATFGLWLLLKTGDIVFVQNQMGHKDLKTTVTHYANYLKVNNTGKVNQIASPNSQMNIINKAS